MSESAIIPPNPFKPTKRIVTGNNPEGKAVVIFEDELKANPMAPGEERTFSTRVWVSKDTPANNSDNTYVHLPYIYIYAYKGPK